MIAKLLNLGGGAGGGAGKAKVSSGLDLGVFLGMTKYNSTILWKNML